MPEEVMSVDGSVNVTTRVCVVCVCVRVMFIKLPDVDLGSTSELRVSKLKL